MMRNSQLDEGYSEGAETRSQSDSDMIYTAVDLNSSSEQRVQEVLQYIMALPSEERKREYNSGPVCVDEAGCIKRLMREYRSHARWC